MGCTEEEGRLHALFFVYFIVNSRLARMLYNFPELFWGKIHEISFIEHSGYTVQMMLYICRSATLCFMNSTFKF